MEIKAIKHDTIRGRSIPYIVLTNEFGQVVIQVGEKNYNDCTMMLEKEEESKKPVKEVKTK